MGNKIKGLRVSRKWTQQKLADELGMSIDYVKSVEAGRRCPSLQVINKLYSIFSCKSYDELLQAS